MVKVNRSKLDEIAQKHGVVAIYVHGSRVKGYAAPDSDTDVAVVVRDKKKLEYGHFGYKVENEILGLLEVKEPDVRVVDYGSSPVYLFAVISGGKVIYEVSSRERVKFETLVLRNYYEYQHLADIYRNYLYLGTKAGVYAHN